MEILSASKGIEDLNFAKDVLQDLRVQNKGAFRAVDAILSEAKDNYSKVKSEVDSVSPVMDKLEKTVGCVRRFELNSVTIGRTYTYLYCSTRNVKQEESS